MKLLLSLCLSIFLYTPCIALFIEPEVHSVKNIEKVAHSKLQKLRKESTAIIFHLPKSLLNISIIKQKTGSFNVSIATKFEQKEDPKKYSTDDNPLELPTLETQQTIDFLSIANPSVSNKLSQDQLTSIEDTLAKILEKRRYLGEDSSTFKVINYIYREEGKPPYSSIQYIQCHSLNQETVINIIKTLFSNYKPSEEFNFDDEDPLAVEAQKQLKKNHEKTSQ